MRLTLFLFLCLFFFLTKAKYHVNNLQKQNKLIYLVGEPQQNNCSRSFNNSKQNFHYSYINNVIRKLNKGKKKQRIHFDRNGINVPTDVSMYGQTNIYYIRESLYEKDLNNLKKNEIDSFVDEDLGECNYDEDSYDKNDKNYKNYKHENIKNIANHVEVTEKETGNRHLEELQSEHKQDSEKAETDSVQTNPSKVQTNPSNVQANPNNVFKYLNTPKDYVVQEGNSPKVSIYDRVYNANEKTLQRFFDNVNEVNIQLLKSIKSIDEKEKLINKRVIEKVQEDIKNYEEMNEILDVKGNKLKPSVEEIKNKKESKKKNTSSVAATMNTTDLDEEEKNELIKKLYIVDKKTDKYIEENVYFVLQTWVPDLKIDDTLIIIDNIEKGYNDYDISAYYEKFNQAKRNNFYYDFEQYKIENVPQHINNDTEIECEHVNSYNNTYNKLNNYNMKKYTYTYTTNENIDIKINKNEPLPPIVIINTKKNSVVQEWEGKNFKNRLKKRKSHEYTRIQRAFRPFSYVDLEDITCIYKYNYLQLKIKLSHRKYKNEIYPFFVPINKNSSEDILDFNGYKQNGDNAWSFFWHNFNYDKDTDYSFLNKSLKLNITESKFEEVNKKRSKKIMRNILRERKGK